MSISAETLWQHLFGDDEGYLVSFSGRQHPDRTNELTGIRQLSFSYPAEANKAATQLRTEANEGRDAYFGVHLFNRAGTRRRTDAASCVRALWLDEDEGKYPDDAPQPSIIVNSSESRRHLYWTLSEPLPAERAVSLNRRIASHAGGDMGKAALSTVLRVPETFNYKRLPVVDPVTALHTGVGPYSPDELDALLPPLPGEETQRERRTYTGPPGEKLDLREFLDSAGVVIRGEVLDGSAERVFRIVCPWLREHTGEDRSGTRVGQYADGATFFRCEHAHCDLRRWAEFKREVDPEVPTRVKRCKARRVWKASA